MKRPEAQSKNMAQTYSNRYRKGQKLSPKTWHKPAVVIGTPAGISTKIDLEVYYIKSIFCVKNMYFSQQQSTFYNLRPMMYKLCNVPFLQLNCGFLLLRHSLSRRIVKGNNPVYGLVFFL